ncbi:CYFIP-related Rac1 interactor B [Octopus sinensis]|uniref:CYFIP-related Rac1 interactor B n=1 Tax=Octopus sinensis TaxID=2607531 RepID=A0A6P7TPI3_9MOLL|nr:CYFIP-related Rac1 interactor B [Octopus sinensis]
MGNLLRVLTKDDSTKNYDAYVDFENAQPTEKEIDVWTQVNEVLLCSNSILADMASYHGAAEEIRLAISFPQNQEHQENAWAAVYPMVLKLKEFYEFSISLENVIPTLLRELCSSNMTSRQHLETQQALFKQFAEILDFVLKFDDYKMTTPAIQNDFSYYRRTVSRQRMTNEDGEAGETEVSNETANRMSLFYAHATPMLKMLSDTTTKFVTQVRHPTHRHSSYSSSSFVPFLRMGNHGGRGNLQLFSHSVFEFYFILSFLYIIY